MIKIFTILLVLFIFTVGNAFCQSAISVTSYGTFSEKSKAEGYKKEVQAVLDSSKGSYSGPPWIQVCIVPVFDGTFAIPLPLPVGKYPPTVIGKIVKTLPIQPIGVQIMEE